MRGRTESSPSTQQEGSRPSATPEAGLHHALTLQAPPPWTSQPPHCETYVSVIYVSQAVMFCYSSPS